jgi:hypothetical protein
MVNAGRSGKDNRRKRTKLRAWDKAGTIPTKRSGGNTRLYDVSAYITESICL